MNHCAQKNANMCFLRRLSLSLQIITFSLPLMLTQAYLIFSVVVKCDLGAQAVALGRRFNAYLYIQPMNPCFIAATL